MKRTIYLRKLIAANRKGVKFFVMFIGIFVIGQIGYSLSKSLLEPVLVHKATAGMSSLIINFITPHEKTSVAGDLISSQDFGLRIAPGCEGVESLLIILSAICAYPVDVRTRMFGALAGSLLVYVLNLARIVGLYYTMKYKPDMFDVMHIYVGQTLIIVVGLLFFLRWASRHGKAA